MPSNSAGQSNTNVGAKLNTQSILRSVQSLALTRTEDDLAQKRILVTGATSGLGWELATRLSTIHGANVIAIGRRKDKLIELQQSCVQGRGSIEVQTLDIACEESVDYYFKRVLSGHLDGAILNAGITYAGRFEGGNFSKDKSIISTNVNAVTQMSRLLLPHLQEGRGRSRLMLVGSMGGVTPLPFQTVYAGTKAFVLNFGLSLRHELKCQGIDVLVFAPGGFRTEMTDGEFFSTLKNDLDPVESIADQAIRAYIRRKRLTLGGKGSGRRYLASLFLPGDYMARIKAGKYARPE